MVHQRQ